MKLIDHVLPSMEWNGKANALLTLSSLRIYWIVWEWMDLEKQEREACSGKIGRCAQHNTTSPCTHHSQSLLPYGCHQTPLPSNKNQQISTLPTAKEASRPQNKHDALFSLLLRSRSQHSSISKRANLPYASLLARSFDIPGIK